MTELDIRWARTRVEAMADGSLSRKDERRMRALLAGDTELRRAVAQARALRKALRGLRGEPVPASILARLSKIPAAATPPRQRWSIERLSWASAAAAAGAVAAVLVLATQPDPARDDPRIAALRDFELAMAYVHRSYEIAGEHVKRTMERELREALRYTERGGDEPRGGNGG